MTMDNNTLKVNEIFYSIQGEGTRAGLPCVFVRLAGCNLRCKWCDTLYAIDDADAEVMNFDEIIEKIKTFDCNFIEFTGGEPLLQPNASKLINCLASQGYIVAVETNGSMPVDILDKSVIKIIDVKCLSSGMDKFNLLKNFHNIGKDDEIKFVIADENDFLWSDRIIKEYDLLNKTGNILFSAVVPACSHKSLAELILKTNSRYRLQLQLHKHIWGADATGV